MRAINRKLRTRAAATALLAGATVTGLVLSAAPASAAPAGGAKDCIEFHTWSTTLVVDYQDAPPEGPSIRDEVTYHENLFQISDDVKVGERDGYENVLFERPGDNHLIGIMLDTATFPDGVVSANGFVDFTSAIAGNSFTIPAFGKSGRYVGYTGTYTIADTGFTSRDEVHIKLCRH